MVTSGSLSSHITQRSNSNQHVGFKIFEHLVAQGDDLFQKWTCLYPGCERPYISNIFDAWWASKNADSKWPIGWDNSRHATLWRFCLHCGIEETGSSGIICIVCHQVLRHPSEHGTSSIGKHLLAQADIAKLNELTESEVTELTSSMVDETALAILRRQGSQGITILSSPRKIIFDIQVDPYWLKWLTKCTKLAAKDIETSECHRYTWNCYLMSGFVLAHTPWNAISNLELRRSYKALRNDLVLLSATTLSNVCQWPVGTCSDCWCD